MTLDCNKYRINVGPIRALTKGKSQKERYQLISSLAIVTDVPVIVVVCYLGELYGFDKDMIALLFLLKDFYHITDVLNVERSQKATEVKE